MSAASRLLLAVALAAAAAILAPAPASAGSYSVHQCDWAAGIADHDFVWQASGSPPLIPHTGSNCSEFGLSARNSSPGHEHTYPSGGYGGWFAYAPPGTAITHFSGAFGTLAGCCINGLATYAEATQLANGSGGRSYLFQGNLGNETWYAPSGLQGPVGRGWDASTSGFAAQRVGFHVRCGPGFSCFQRTTGDLRVRGRSFRFTLRDDVPPAVGGPDGTLLADRWQRGSHTLRFAAGDVGGGIAGVEAELDNGTTLAQPAPCATAGGSYVRLQPCPLAHAGGWTVDTAKLPDGPRTVTLRVRDVGGATAASVHSLRVDNSAPVAPRDAAVAGGDGWRAANGFAVRWANPASQQAPIAGARFSVCRAGGGDCASGAKAGDGIAALGGLAVPGAGEWDVRVWLEDAAGNESRAHATGPLRLRLDPDPPLLRFLPIDPAAPAIVAAEVEDLSGLADGAIELKRIGTKVWHPIPTARHGTRLEADVDAARLAPGVYELRARAVDAAGNQAVLDGKERTLPARTPTRLRAVVERRVALRRVGCRPARAPRCRTAVTVRRTVVRARHGSTVAIRGRLETVAGQPLAGRAVAIELVSRDGTRPAPGARTDAAGNFALTLPARRSAVVRLRFDGDRGVLPSARELGIQVPAPVTFATARRSVRGGGPTRFRGRVGGGSIPGRGKLVEVQAHFRGRWRTISTVRTGPAGRWRFSYAFRPAAATARYRLRARVPVEAGYPFAAAVSRPVRVTVPPR